VSGELAEGSGAVDVLRAAFPAGTLSGAPKVRAMQIIEQLEPLRRGVYGGAVGYVGFPVDGRSNLDFAIAIRTLVTLGERVLVQAGAGIVHDSVPESEYQETVNKARAVVRAIEIARAASHVVADR
jgi:anthranilate synthase component 1